MLIADVINWRVNKLEISGTVVVSLQLHKFYYKKNNYVCIPKTVYFCNINKACQQ